MALESKDPNPGLLSAATVGDYLVARGTFRSSGVIEVHELGGGVSNVVYAARQNRSRVVVKQALGRLRVSEEWFAERARALTEGGALVLAGRLAPGSVPEVLDLDSDACALTIEAAPSGWISWKEQLLSGNADPAIAARLGELLATWHAGTLEPAAASAFGTPRAFDELRVDPYYRTVAKRRPELRDAIDAYVRQMEANRQCLVHGDYSPKNVLVGDGLWVIDFEVAHRGDPSFDLAFMLSHLMLKRLHLHRASSGLELCAEAFWSAYERSCAPLIPQTSYVLGHVGCLMVARVDGKSPVEYLAAAEREAARTIGSALLLDPPGTIAEALSVSDELTS